MLQGSIAAPAQQPCYLACLYILPQLIIIQAFLWLTINICCSCCPHAACSRGAGTGCCSRSFLDCTFKVLPCPRPADHMEQLHYSRNKVKADWGKICMPLVRSMQIWAVSRKRMLISSSSSSHSCKLCISRAVVYLWQAAFLARLLLLTLPCYPQLNDVGLSAKSAKCSWSHPIWLGEAFGPSTVTAT